MQVAAAALHRLTSTEMQERQFLFLMRQMEYSRFESDELRARLHIVPSRRRGVAVTASAASSSSSATSSPAASPVARAQVPPPSARARARHSLTPPPPQSMACDVRPRGATVPAVLLAPEKKKVTFSQTRVDVLYYSAE